ncbi:GNAT family N-acetyltransferase [Deinococcus hohokamensis]|uniref:GNAT family N-acetyltransferase n=1 Tax=Deinococcus hohokamensis TaxID=309883 RepID=A0ABV9ICV9_9DEIO
MSGPPVQVRPVRPGDEVALGRVAYQTGFFGESAEHYFPDAGLFADLWVRPYLHGAGAACFVAVGPGEEVLGYVLGAPGPARYRRALWRVGRTRLRPRLRRLDPALRASLRHLIRLARFPGPRADSRQFPAHLHLNLLPQARGQGVGAALLTAHLDGLRALGVPGVQLSTTTENRAALRLYRRFGFREAGRRVSPLWTPWLGHPAEHVVMVLALKSAPAAAPD